MALASSRSLRYLVLFISIAVAMLAGCNRQSSRGNQEPVSNATVDGALAENIANDEDQDAGEELVQPVRVERPTVEGRRLFYFSNVESLNLDGSSDIAPFTPVLVWEYQIGNDWRAVAILDELSRHALVIRYETYEEEERTFALAGEDDLPQGEAWLLRASFKEPVTEEQVRQFLANPEDTTKAFPLQGKVSLSLEDGFFQRLSLENVQTRNKIPPNIDSLRHRVDSLKEELNEMREKLQADPDNELLRWRKQMDEDRLADLEHLIENQPESTARFSNGYIHARWGPSKPLLLIEPL